MWILIGMLAAVIGYMAGSAAPQTTVWAVVAVTGILSVATAVLAYAARSTPHSSKQLVYAAVVIFVFAAMTWVGYSVATEDISRTVMPAPGP